MADTAPTSAFKSLWWLNRFLAVWIFLAMVFGVLLGNFVSNIGPPLQKGKLVGDSIPITVGLLVMMYSILCKVRYQSLHTIFANRSVWRQSGFSIFVNWIVAPFFMVFFSPGVLIIYISKDNS
jgi:arsenite transporter